MMRKDKTRQPDFIRSNVNLAINLFRSKKIITIFVEGEKDKCLLMSCFIEQKIRFVPMEGKKYVIDAMRIFKRQGQAVSGIFFLVDVDYDYLLNKLDEEEKNLMYSFYCTESKRFFFNDIEAFLVNTNSLLKVIINLKLEGFEKLDYNELRQYLMCSAGKIGSIRAADEKLQVYPSDKSILDGLDLFEFISFDYKETWDMVLDEKELKNRLNNSSPRKLDIDELFSTAKKLFESHKDNLWKLARGHDVTLILKDFLIRNLNARILRNDSDANHLEALLRMSIDKEDFLKTNVGKKLLSLIFSP